MERDGYETDPGERGGSRIQGVGGSLCTQVRSLCCPSVQYAWFVTDLSDDDDIVHDYHPHDSADDSAVDHANYYNTGPIKARAAQSS